MVFYFFGDYHNKKEIEKKLKEIGFQEKRFHPYYPISYVLNEELFIINPSKDRIEIQGDGPGDIRDNGKASEHFSQLEKLAKLLKPKYILDAGCKEVFPELNKKIQ